ncbi:TetR/AcrR family transcriptional regulator [Streptomyces sp. NPDC004610]|uniref:TetR/AcrR family transcriptional regulator n=1 Tax=unclassified Streptomyces TaxID=2593676 RepID=UPI0033B77308
MPRGRFAKRADGAAARDGRSAPAPVAADGTASEGSRERILRAAAEVIREQGFAQTRVAQIAERAQVSGGTVVYHFETLDRLLVQALRDVEDRFYAAADEILHDDGAVRDRLLALAGRVLSAEGGNPQLRAVWLDSWAHAVRHEEIAAMRAAQDDRWRALVLRLVGELPLEPDRARQVATTYAALLDGLSVQVALDDPVVDPAMAHGVVAAYLDRALPASSG